MFSFYDVRNVISYNTLFNFIISNRGYGKTFGFKEYVIKKYKRKKTKFIYLRRYKSELKEAKQKFFADIIAVGHFPDDEFEVKGNDFLINGEVMGHAVALSTTINKKSVSYPDVEDIIFDEFILDKGTIHYIQGEVKAFLNYYETVARIRDNVKVYFLANAITMTNPYFIEFDMTDILKEGVEFYRPRKDIVLQYVFNEEFTQHKEQTRFGQLVEGTEFAESSIRNKFVYDNRDFIEQKTPTANYYVTLKYRGELYGVWADWQVGKIFITTKVDKSWLLVYSLTVEDHAPNMLLKTRKSVLLETIAKSYRMGAVRFESLKVKSEMKNALKIIL